MGEDRLLWLDQGKGALEGGKGSSLPPLSTSGHLEAHLTRLNLFLHQGPG